MRAQTSACSFHNTTVRKYYAGCTNGPKLLCLMQSKRGAVITLNSRPNAKGPGRQILRVPKGRGDKHYGFPKNRAGVTTGCLVAGLGRVDNLRSTMKSLVVFVAAESPS